jgi:integrase
MPLTLKPPRAGKTPYWSVRGTYLGVHVDRSTGLADRGKAAKLLGRWREEIERGEFSRPGAPTFLSAAVAYMKAGGERRFVSPLLNHFEDKPLAQIDQQAIDDAAFRLYPNATPATRNRQVYSVVSAILKQAGVADSIRRPKGSTGKQRTDWLWPEQAFRLFHAADDQDAEFGIFVRTLCYTGLRLGEALALTVSGTRLTESFTYVPNTKNTDPRPVYLPAVVVAALAEHPRGMEREGERIFRFRKNGRLYTLLNRAKEAAGSDLAAATFHTLRHTWATWMRRYGGLDTKGLVGTGAWRDQKSAGRYEHVVPTEEAMRAALLPTERKAG